MIVLTKLISLKLNLSPRKHSLTVRLSQGILRVTHKLIPLNVPLSQRVRNIRKLLLELIDQLLGYFLLIISDLQRVHSPRNISTTPNGSFHQGGLSHKL